jgi:hypothetical protein
MKRMLADVLWEAANKHLCVIGGGSDCDPSVAERYLMRYSCNAIFRALGLKPRYLSDDVFQLPRSVVAFLISMGCDPDMETYFKGMAHAEQQGIRYMWLLLAMHVAEDEGIEV